MHLVSPQWNLSLSPLKLIQAIALDSSHYHQGISYDLQKSTLWSIVTHIWIQSTQGDLVILPSLSMHHSSQYPHDTIMHLDSSSTGTHNIALNLVPQLHFTTIHALININHFLFSVAWNEQLEFITHPSTMNSHW